MGLGDVVGDFVDGAKQVVNDPVGTVAGVFDIGEARGSDGGSSNWSAWGHQEIREMLDTTVEPADIEEGARAWGELQQEAANIVTGLTRDLHGIVSGGWRGASADAAITSLRPVDQWAASLSEAAAHTAQLMDASGSAAGQAKATVPPAQPHDWRRSLGSFALGGGAGAFIDAVAQDRAQEEARAEAVRIMTNVYSAPINENTAAVPLYPQLADPTLQPAEPSPVGGPSPGAGTAGPGLPGGGGGAVGGNATPRPLSTAGLQDVPSGSGPASSGVSTPGQLVGPRQPGGDPRGGGFGGVGSGAGTAAGVPLTAPLGGAGAGGDTENSRQGFRGAGLGGGRPSGIDGRAGGGVGSGPSFGPRGSGGSASAAEGRFGIGPGGGAGTVAGGGAAGRGGAGGVPLIGAGAGPGQGSEDTEHRRPSYLIEMDDIFGDGRKVAPPVIGEEPPEYYR